MAVADDALFGIDSLEQLQEFRISQGKLQVKSRYRSEALKLSILRNCTKSGGVLNKSMTEDEFQSTWKSTLSNADYFVLPMIYSL